ncbi:hypothetical protein MKW98_000730 [Papaver atlanticum]|uniref:Uncharacterized protein n=1 Tax=Papaver atlanticum TaxID=357466 RepID=A0AAD4SCE1_9MAGN|nr:hypothetical protein MKW98_000730 [Papaver atlanticum]
MRAPNYTLEEDLALVSGYIDFGGDGVVGVQQKKRKTMGEDHTLFCCTDGKFDNRNQYSLQARIEYMKIYWKAFPHEYAYKIFKYVKGYDYTKYTDEDEEDVLVVPIPTVEFDREDEEEKKNKN